MQLSVTRGPNLIVLASTSYAEPALAIEGNADHCDHRVDDDHWVQPGNLFRLMTPAQQQVLIDNTARNITGASQEVIARHIADCTRADPA